MDGCSWKDMAIKAGIAGLIGVSGSLAMGENFANTASLGPLNMTAPLMVSVATASASVVADVAHCYVLSNIPMDQKWNNLESAAIGVAVSGLGTVAVLKLAGAANRSMLGGVALGGASFMGADYISSKVLKRGPSLGLF